MKGLIVASVVALVLIAQPVSAEGVRWKAVQGWMIDKDVERQRCQAGSIYGGAGETIVLVIYEPSTDTAELRIGNKGWTSLKDGDDPKVTLVLGDEGTYNQVETTSVVTSDYKWLLMNFHGLEFLADFAFAPSLHVFRGDVVVDKLNLRGTRMATQELIRCANSINNGIARDPFADSGASSTSEGRVSQRAGLKGNPGQFFGPDAYPPEAIGAKAQGRVVASLTVGTDGRVSACTVTSSSGNGDLDAATCRIALSRVRFTPAKDDNGAPIASTYTLPVRWELPPPPPEIPSTTPAI